MKSELLQLLSRRTFFSFFTTQFLGAFNDNLYKTALSLLIAFTASQQSETASSILVNLAAVLFILPFFIFSPRAGSLADQREKVALIQRIKLIEILIMGIGVVGFYFSNTWLLLLVLFLMGAQSTFFGPLKYSYLPSLLELDQLVSANALIQASTFIAIILGMMLAGVLYSLADDHLILVSGSTLLLALLGFVSSRFMVRGQPLNSPESAENKGFVSLIRMTRGKPLVWQAILGISWFWMVGATYITQLPNLVRFYAYADEQVFLLCLGLFAVGIGSGAMLCSSIKHTWAGRFSVLMGLAGLLLAGLLVAFYSYHPPLQLRGISEFGNGADIWLCTGLFVLGVSGGLYIVPLYTVLQVQSDEQHRSRMIAMNNIMNAVYMVLSAIVAMGLLAAGLSILQLFMLLAVLQIIMAGYFALINPLFLLNIRQLYTF